ncbi:outer membrane beta-barrel protein [Bradyrhizobium sp. 142]|uniref:outer membrane protein n=1 Tax=Bradyrhizobium sp. 142 TaxID=2782618 RepID=UPI001FFAF5BD|nr:outer membrane beta-barrel protein [Bradyrhizobium sp. 142]MCK1725338.1 porin family protein [Bradyrhizobium sp. 142]
MKKLFATLAATTALVSAASAADLAAHYTKAPVAAPITDWTGVYLGVSAGGVWGTNEWSSDESPPYRPGSYNTSGWTAGGIVGANIQVRNTVLGVEFDGNWADVSGSKAIGTPFNGLGNNIASIDNKIDWTAHARARLGYSFGNWLPFVAGGAAIAGVHDKLNLIAPVVFNGAVYPAYSNSATRVGFTVGGGIDFKVAPNVIVRGEYLYDNFGNTTGRLGAPTFNTEAFTLDTHTVRAALMYKFD